MAWTSFYEHKFIKTKRICKNFDILSYIHFLQWDVPVTVFGSSRYVVMGYTQNALIRLDACNDRNKKKNIPAVMYKIPSVWTQIRV
jgi:hypothetical protein